MATLNFDIDALDDHGLPPICAVCGDRAAEYVVRKFAWYPPYMAIFGLLAALLVTKRTEVDVPLCEKHLNHWTWRAWVRWGGVGAAFALMFGGFCIVGAFAKGGNDTAGAIAGFTFLAGVLLVLAAAITGIVLAHTAIRATEITEYTIKLTNLADELADAVEAPAAENDLLARRRRRR